MSSSRGRSGSRRPRRTGNGGGGRRPGGGLTVAVTGPTGTFGSALLPLLQDDDRIGRVIGIARRPFDPAHRSWTKMTYRQGDVRDREPSGTPSGTPTWSCTSRS